MSGISCQPTPWISGLYYQGIIWIMFPVANLADFLTTRCMFTLAHMGLCQLTLNRRLRVMNDTLFQCKRGLKHGVVVQESNPRRKVFSAFLERKKKTPNKFKELLLNNLSHCSWTYQWRCIQNKIPLFSPWQNLDGKLLTCLFLAVGLKKINQ